MDEATWSMVLESVFSSLRQRSKSLLLHFILGVSFSSVICIPVGAWIFWRKGLLSLISLMSCTCWSVFVHQCSSKLILIDRTRPAGRRHEEWQDASVRRSMLLMECRWLNWMRHLKLNATKDILISNGGMKIPTLTLAPMGMVAPWRCQELQIFGKQTSALSIGQWNKNSS